MYYDKKIHNIQKWRSFYLVYMKRDKEVDLFYSLEPLIYILFVFFYDFPSFFFRMVYPLDCGLLVVPSLKRLKRKTEYIESESWLLRPLDLCSYTSLFLSFYRYF